MKLRKKIKNKKWSFASLLTCQVKPLTSKMNTVKRWQDEQFYAHVPKCVGNSSSHLPFNNAAGCHLSFDLFALMRARGVRTSPPHYPRNRPNVSCPFWQQWLFLAMICCQEAKQSSNLPRYPSFKCARDASKFRSNPITLVNISDTLWRRCGMV